MKHIDVYFAVLLIVLVGFNRPRAQNNDTIPITTDTMGTLVLTADQHGNAVPIQTPSVSDAESVAPGVPPGPVPPTDTFSWQVGLAIFSNRLIRWLKDKRSIPIVREGAGWINVALSLVLASGAALGIHTQFDAAAGTLAITGLTLTSIIHFGGESFRQYLFQQLAYEVTKEKYVP